VDAYDQAIRQIEVIGGRCTVRLSEKAPEPQFKEGRTPASGSDYCIAFETR